MRPLELSPDLKLCFVIPLRAPFSVVTLFSFPFFSDVSVYPGNKWKNSVISEIGHGTGTAKGRVFDNLDQYNRTKAGVPT